MTWIERTAYPRLRTLAAMLGHALDHRVWDDANYIVQPLDAYWDARGLGEEAAAWADRILAATVGPGQAPHGAARSLWLHAIGQRANRQRDAGQPDQAAEAYRQALAWLQEQPETEWARKSIALTCHRLGTTAQDRGRLDEADDWYRKALTIKEDRGDRPGMALTYGQLGPLAEARKQGCR